MSKKVKSEIYRLLDTIEDETVLSQVMEDITFYASKKDIIDTLTPEQADELDKAIKEATKKETITLNEFKKEMNEWHTIMES